MRALCTWLQFWRLVGLFKLCLLPFHVTVIVCWKVDMTYWVTRAPVHRPWMEWGKCSGVLWFDLSLVVSLWPGVMNFTSDSWSSLSPFGGIGWLEVGISFPPGKLGFIKTPAFYVLVKLCLLRAGLVKRKMGCPTRSLLAACDLRWLWMWPSQNHKFTENLFLLISFNSVCVFNVWPKTTLLLPLWPRDTKRLDTLFQNGCFSPFSFQKDTGISLLLAVRIWKSFWSLNLENWGGGSP